MDSDPHACDYILLGSRIIVSAHLDHSLVVWKNGRSFHAIVLTNTANWVPVMAG